MGVLVMLEMDGDTQELLAALDRVPGHGDGLLMRIVAPTPDGAVLFHLWESDEARQRNQEDEGSREAVRASGLLDLMTASRSTPFEGARLVIPSAGQD